MIVTKKKHENDTRTSSHGAQRYIPIDEHYYPEYFEDERYRYYRFYVRPRFVVYECYDYLGYSPGYMCMTSNGEAIVYGFKYMNDWADANENNMHNKILSSPEKWQARKVQ